MNVTCPQCQTRFPLAAGFLDDDGKRLAALMAGMEPALGRAVITYLGLFKPAHQSLRTSRAVKLVRELVDLVEPGSVCKDERGGVRRPATAATWAAGIEQMLAEPGRLTLPLTNHRYLRAIVYGLADHADAVREAHRDEQLRAQARTQTVQAQRGTSLHEALMRIRTDVELGLIDKDEAARREAVARQEI